MSSVPNPHLIDADTLTGDLRPLRRAALALGSNVGDRLENLQGAVNTLTEAPELVAVAVSPVYETVPVGGPPDQPPYLNAVLIVETTLSPRTLLERAQATEIAYGRTRDEHWGPRTLDIDVLAVGDKVIDTPDFKLPHSRLAGRAFVLAPWADVDPDFLVPGMGSVRMLLSGVDTSGVRRRDDLVLELPS